MTTPERIPQRASGRAPTLSPLLPSSPPLLSSSPLLSPHLSSLPCAPRLDAALDADHLLDGGSCCSRRNCSSPLRVAPLVAATPLAATTPLSPHSSPLHCSSPLLQRYLERRLSPFLYASLSSPRRHISSTPLPLLIHPRLRPRRSRRQSAPHALRMCTCFCVSV